MSVFVMSNRNIVIPSPDGKEFVRLNRGGLCQVPDWAAKTAYFKALAQDGKMVVSENKKDKDQESKSRKGRRSAGQESAKEEQGEDNQESAEQEADEEAQEGGE